MTIGLFNESIMGKMVAHTGKEGDGTPLTDLSVSVIIVSQSILYITIFIVDKPLSQKSKHLLHTPTMYNFHLGRKLTSMIFLGPTYYQQL